MTTGLWIATVLLLAYGLIVRFAGERKVLNFVDYARVADRTVLHRWAGNRLLLAAAAVGALWLASAWLGLPILVAIVLFVGVMVSTGAWLVAGSDRFHVR